MIEHTNSENKRNNTTKSLVTIILLVTSFFAADLLVGIIVSPSVNNATAAGDSNSTAAGDSHANNETSDSGNTTSVPGTSQIGDRRHAPV